MQHCGEMNDEEARFKHDAIKDHKKAAMKNRQVSICPFLGLLPQIMSVNLNRSRPALVVPVPLFKQHRFLVQGEITY